MEVSIDLQNITTLYKNYDLDSNMVFVEQKSETSLDDDELNLNAFFDSDDQEYINNLSDDELAKISEDITALDIPSDRTTSN